MKKVLMLLIGCFLVILAACTHEDSTDFNTGTRAFQQKSGGSKLDSLYTVMKTSSRYIDLQVLRQDFSKKMNFTGDAATLKKENDFLDWINNNLSNTGFTDYKEAINDWNKMKVETGLLIGENIDFYYALAAEPKGSTVFYDILINDLPEVEAYASCTCWGDYQANIADFMSSYLAANLAISNQLSGGDVSPSDAGVDSNTINNALTESLNAANEIYMNCIEECD